MFELDDDDTFFFHRQQLETRAVEPRAGSDDLARFTHCRASDFYCRLTSRRVTSVLAPRPPPVSLGLANLNRSTVAVGCGLFW